MDYQLQGQIEEATREYDGAVKTAHDLADELIKAIVENKVSGFMNLADLASKASSFSLAIQDLQSKSVALNLLTSQLQQEQVQPAPSQPTGSTTTSEATTTPST
jgi:hypothetical protein